MEVECPLFEISDPDNISIYLEVSDAEHRLEFNDINLSNAKLVDAHGWMVECIPLNSDHGALKIVGRSDKNIKTYLEKRVMAYLETHAEHFSQLLGGSIPQHWNELVDQIRSKGIWF